MMMSMVSFATRVGP